MSKDSDNIILVKTKSFALRCIKLYSFLCDTKKEFVISKQVLKSGTSIGANVREAVRGQSDADFGAKMNIALKEASETEYWIELLQESGILTFEQTNELLEECRELNRILTAIVKSTFKKSK